MRPAEREIGVREGEHVGEPRVGRRIRIERWQVRIPLGRRRRASRLLRIEEACGVREAGDALEAANRFAGVVQAGLEADPRIVLRLRTDDGGASRYGARNTEHSFHAVPMGSLKTA